MIRRRHATSQGKPGRKTVSYRPVLELLESRQLLTAGLASQLANSPGAIAEPAPALVPQPLDSPVDGQGEGVAAVPHPILILPGILGSLPVDNLADWLTFDPESMSPEHLRVDPIKLSYDDLMAALIAAGYNDAPQAGLQTLWAAPDHWRLPVLPRDGALDGHIDTTQLDPSDSVWEYGVEYVHYWINRARDAWVDGGLDPGQFSVDIVAHSMGGLLARSYLQSDLYQPGEVNQLLMLGTPNHGAVDAYQIREWINGTLTLCRMLLWTALPRGLPTRARSWS